MKKLVWLAAAAVLLADDDDDSEPPWPLGDPPAKPPGEGGDTDAADAADKAGGYAPSNPDDPKSWAQVPTTGPGWEVRHPTRAWGSGPAVFSLTEALKRNRIRQQALGLDEVVKVGDFSKRLGGPLPPHLSHDKGRDVDLSFSGRLPVLPTTLLLYALLQDDNVGVVWLSTDRQREVYDAAATNPDLVPGLQSELQYPLPAKKGKTRVRHWKGHRNHLHVRFRE